MDQATDADQPAAEAVAEQSAEQATEAAPHIEEVTYERLEVDQVVAILEAALQAAEHPLTVDQCQKLFRRGELPVSNNETQRELVKRLLEEMEGGYEGRGVELKRVASGYRLQVRQEYSRWVSRLWEEKPPRYSRALLETMSLIAYRQPVTRGDIEQVRGVAVSQSIMRTLSERGWIREVGHREVPGRPALYGTTKAFLDYFNLKSLAQLPPLEEIRELIEPAVVAEEVGADAGTDTDAGEGSGEAAAAAPGETAQAPANTAADDGAEAADAQALAEAQTTPEAEHTGIEVSLDDGEAPASDSETPADDADIDPAQLADVVPLPRKG